MFYRKAILIRQETVLSSRSYMNLQDWSIAEQAWNFSHLTWCGPPSLELGSSGFLILPGLDLFSYLV